jgi:hypothetical protein
MKTILWTSLITLLLALDWAALHDILKGEPNLYAEYGMLAFSAAAFAVLIFLAARKKGGRAGYL